MGEWKASFIIPKLNEYKNQGIQTQKASQKDEVQRKSKVQSSKEKQEEDCFKIKQKTHE